MTLDFHLDKKAEKYMAMNIQKLNRENISKAISEIEKIDLKKVDILQIERLLTPLFAGFTVNAPVFSPPLDIYRGRICNDKPDCLSQIRQPPSQKSGKAGKSK